MKSLFSDVTSAQLRAARALLGWSQKELAQAAGVAISTLAEFERDVRTPHRPNLIALKNALEKAGIEFIPSEVGEGADYPKGTGVRFARLAPHEQLTEES